MLAGLRSIADLEWIDRDQVYCATGVEPLHSHTVSFYSGLNYRQIIGRQTIIQKMEFIPCVV